MAPSASITNPSSLSYVSGTAAAALGLTQASGAIDSSPGGQHPTTAEFMNNLVQNETASSVRFRPTFHELRRLWRLGLSRLRLSVHITLALTPPRRQDRAYRPPIPRAHTAVPERARRRRRRRGLIYRSPGRPLLAAEIDRPCRLLQSGGRERADTRPARILRPDTGHELRDAGRSWLLHAVRGRDRGAPGAAADHIGHGGGAVYAFGADRHAVFFCHDYRYKQAYFRQSFDPDHGRRRQTVRRRRLQWAHGKRGWRLPPFGDRSRDHQRTRRTCFYSEHVLRDDDIYFDRHDEPRHEREQREHDSDGDEWRASLFRVEFLADQSTLDKIPGGFDILDSAANITATSISSTIRTSTRSRFRTTAMSSHRFSN